MFDLKGLVRIFKLYNILMMKLKLWMLLVFGIICLLCLRCLLPVVFRTYKSLAERASIS